MSLYFRFLFLLVKGGDFTYFICIQLGPIHRPKILLHSQSNPPSTLNCPWNSTGLSPSRKVQALFETISQFAAPFLLTMDFGI